MNEIYRQQVDLLLSVIPFVAEEKCFALKGGTAINLFVRNLPRLSVDIDLTYIPFDKRDIALVNIAEALDRIKIRAEKLISNLKITKAIQSDGNETKLICLRNGVHIKIEVNTVMRGHLFDVEPMKVSDKVEDEFSKSATISVLSSGELYGGKLCAALDRQHPRDLFDVQQLLKYEGITPKIKQGLIAALLSHPRPIHEVLFPNLQDRKDVFYNQFEGMTVESFEYKDFEETRIKFINEVTNSLTENEKKFLVSFAAGNPDWNLINIPNIEKLPAVQWKLLNINKLAKENPKKHEKQLKDLIGKLEKDIKWM